VLSSVYVKTMWDRRRSILWWAAGVAALVIMTVAFYPTIAAEQDTYSQLFESMESFAGILGVDDISELTEPSGYMNSQLYANSLAIILLVFAIGIGTSAVAGEEDRRTMDLLLAQPVKRRRVVLDAFLAMATMTFGLAGVVMVLELVANAPFDLNLGVSGLLAANVGVALLALAFGALALAIGGLTGRRGLTLGVSSGLAVATFFIYGLAPLVDAIEWTQELSPFYWFLGSQPLRDGFDPLFGWLILMIAMLLAVAVWGFERRDVSV